MISLDDIFEVRRSVGDPVTGGFTLVDVLPETAPQNTAYTTGNGEYLFFDGVEWRNYSIKTGDAYIRLLLEKHGRLRTSIKLVDNMTAQINPEDFLQSGNAGGQSMSFPSLRDVLDYYDALRERLLEEEAAENGTNSGLMLAAKKRPVGGVLEDYE